MTQLVYEEYQQKLYSLSACSNDYTPELMEENKLTLSLLQSGVTCPSKQPKVQPIKLHKH